MNQIERMKLVLDTAAFYLSLRYVTGIVTDLVQALIQNRSITSDLTKYLGSAQLVKLAMTVVMVMVALLVGKRFGLKVKNISLALSGTILAFSSLLSTPSVFIGIFATLGQAEIVSETANMTVIVMKNAMASLAGPGISISAGIVVFLLGTRWLSVQDPITSHDHQTREERQKLLLDTLFLYFGSNFLLNGIAVIIQTIIAHDILQNGSLLYTVLDQTIRLSLILALLIWSCRVTKRHDLKLQPLQIILAGGLLVFTTLFSLPMILQILIQTTLQLRSGNVEIQQLRVNQINLGASIIALINSVIFAIIGVLAVIVGERWIRLQEKKQ